MNDTEKCRGTHERAAKTGPESGVRCPESSRTGFVATSFVIRHGPGFWAAAGWAACCRESPHLPGENCR